MGKVHISLPSTNLYPWGGFGGYRESSMQSHHYDRVHFGSQIHIIDYYASFQECIRISQQTFKGKKKVTVQPLGNIDCLRKVFNLNCNASKSYSFHHSSPTSHCMKACCLPQVTWWEQHWWGCNPHMEGCCLYTKHEFFRERCQRQENDMHLWTSSEYWMAPWALWWKRW